MADNFSANNFQGVFGKFQPVLDETVAPTSENFQGVFGKFVPIADEAAGTTPAGEATGSEIGRASCRERV